MIGVFYFEPQGYKATQYRLVEQVGIEPTILESKSSALTAWRLLNIFASKMVSEKLAMNFH